MNPLLQAAVSALVLVNVLTAVRRSRRKAWQAAARVRPSDVLWVVMLAPVVMLCGAGLSTLPLLDWGWWKALGGTGSVVLANDGSGGPLVLGMILVLLLAVPELALREEEFFRRGSEHRGIGGNLRWCILFGSIHALMGIPLGYALALSLAGAYFTTRYLHAYNQERGSREGAAAREHALIEATRAHIAWNWVLLLLAGTALLLG